MGILNILINTSSRPNESNGDFLDLKGTQPLSKRIRVTPIRHLYKVFSIKVLSKNAYVARKEYQALSKGANVRCLDCGWKYNVNSTTQCPICTSERTYLLSNGTFFTGALTIALIVITFCGLLTFAYISITS
ncbi:MAG: hypothetical protein RL524_882 [Actinomycetota bacterium]|jgi:predicted Zn-ribbon and HTH transcriptional regulator